MLINIGLALKSRFGELAAPSIIDCGLQLILKWVDCGGKEDFVAAFLR
jgi:hypothetical protein